jgi:AraC-like DNA-binding protein
MGMQSHLSSVNVIIFSTGEDVLFILRRNIYAQTHRHHALQVTLALEGTLELVVERQKTGYRAVVIDHDYPHLVQGQAGWVATLLVNPESSLARGIQWHLLRGAHSASAEEAFSDGFIEQLTTLMQQPFTNKRLEAMLVRMLSFMPDIPDVCYALDTRIAEALDLVKRAEERRLTAQELSEAVFLSEGRFGHLFREEIGMPMRRYLLWCRLMDALKHIGQGERFTFAAHEAGFSDAAHLSRTFRQMFGMSLSEMFGKTQQILVVFNDPMNVLA